MPSINVNYPSTGDSLRRGSNYIIRWTPLGSMDADVKIELWESTGTTKVLDISLSCENSGLYIWKIPDNQTISDDYYIQITTIDTAVTVDGNDFDIIERYTLGDFTNTEDLEKYVLIEMELGLDLLTGWTITGSGNDSYSRAFTGGELSRIEFNGTELLRVYSSSYCEATEDTYFHDLVNKIIYINIGEDPDGSGNTIQGYTWIGFTNRQDADYEIDFIPDGCITPIYYLPWLSPKGLPNITQKVGEYYTSAVTTQFGSISLLNNGELWEMKSQYNWHNKKTIVKIGEKYYSYDEYVKIFTGVSKIPKWKDLSVMISLKDTRTSELVQIPIDRFDTTTYPNLESSSDNKEIPILFGDKSGIVCVNVNSATYLYQISQTTFNGNSYPLQSIDAVYQAGVQIYETINYTIDLTNGQITLLEDPGDDAITVDAKGIKCQYDFTGTGSGITYPGEATGIYSENVADILFFILTELNMIPLSRLDLESFDDLQTKRTQKIGFYLSSPQQTSNVIRTLQSSTLFHFIPTLAGNYIVRYYDRATPIDSKYYISGEYGVESFELEENTDSAYKNTVIKYDKDPGADIWEEVSEITDEVAYKYQIESTLTVETFLTNKTEAENLRDFYVGLVDQPGDKISAQVSADAMDSIPTDKAFFSRKITKGDGTVYSILEEEVYLLLSVRKNLETGRVDLVGLLDVQAGGQGSHADIPHVDSHEDESHSDYSDSPHSDISHTDSYINNPYVDIPYSDLHTDIHSDDHIDYSDVPHFDTHTDKYTDHTDQTAHTDTAHVDQHNDVPHSDGHTDIHTNTHTDEHGDESHTDSEV